MEMARCTCGGNHGVVPVVVAVENGRTTRWCAVAYNNRFDDCPGCKGRRRDKHCPKGCRTCAKHGWHEGYDCHDCDEVSKAAAGNRQKYFWKPLQYGTQASVTLFIGFLVLIPLLLSLPFIMLLGEWFRDNGFEKIGWAVIIGPTPVIIAPLLVIAVIVLVAYAVAGLLSIGGRRT